MRKFTVKVVRSLLCLGVWSTSAQGQEVALVRSPQDPYGFPRPGVGQENVPLRTSFFFQVEITKDGSDEILPQSVKLQLQLTKGRIIELVSGGEMIASNCSGEIFPATRGMSAEPVLAIYVNPRHPLLPEASYSARLHARSRKGRELSSAAGTWTFTTEPSDRTHQVNLKVDLARPGVHWQGGFFSGFCKPSFCTTDAGMLRTYEFMEEARREYPRAWSLQRDFWLTGMDDKPGILAPRLPNIVRDLQTRRIANIKQTESGTLLKVEDFFGHEQYGIEAGRRLSGDYIAGDLVLIADGIHDARTTVVSVDDFAGALLVSRVETPRGGWTLDYAAPLALREEANSPGLFAYGGCYVRRFNPPGTPRYFWGRLDQEWDLARSQGRRLMPNFADAPGDLSIDGRNWTTARDYAQLHEVVRQITDHVIERYGDESVRFLWSVFNEPDLGGLFWRTNWNELQKFYDYTSDGILRAFEDRGYNSTNVLVGGLELGAIFGTNLKLEDFLIHCSPRARGEGANAKNAAFEDRRLDGKRSRRVEKLCSEHEGRGAPCDFISVHAYNRSEVMAAKLVKAKETALKIDPEYYEKLWINSHESCPGWNPPPDPAAEESYLGNGYFPTWCADVVRRQLDRAAADPRYGYGETILTLWQFPSRNFQGLNTVTRLIGIDQNGDGRTDKETLVRTPVFHFLNLLSTMGPEYWVLPEEVRGGHFAGGFVSRGRDAVQVLVYAHNPLDTQSRSEHNFTVNLEASGLPWQKVRVREYRFDRDHNSYYAVARRLRESKPGSMGAAQLQRSILQLKDGDRSAVLKTIEEFRRAGPDARAALHALAKLADESTDPEIRTASAGAVLAIAVSRPGCTEEEFRQVQESSDLSVTRRTQHQARPGGKLNLEIRLMANGASFLVLEPDER